MIDVESHFWVEKKLLLLETVSSYGILRIYSTSKGNMEHEKYISMVLMDMILIRWL